MEEYMSVKAEKAAETFAKGYNCAQSVLSVFCEEDGLDLNTAFKIATGFGGGLRCGEVCGAVSGAIMALSLKCGFYAEGDIDQKNKCNEKTYEFIEKFTAKHRSILCRDLLGVDIRVPDDHRKPEARQAHQAVCSGLIKDATRVLEDMDFEIK
jgi:C_GCAxxG_C_C family probable redox protein